MVDSHGKTGLRIFESKVVFLLGAENLASMRGKGKLNKLEDPWQHTLSQI